MVGNVLVAAGHNLLSVAMVGDLADGTLANGALAEGLQGAGLEVDGSGRCGGLEVGGSGRCGGHAGDGEESDDGELHVDGWKRKANECVCG